MGARLEGRQKTVNQKIFVRIRDFEKFWVSARAASKIVKTVVFTNRDLLCNCSHKRFHLGVSTTWKSAKKRLRSTRFIIPSRAKALGQVHHAFLCALHSVICDV